MDLNDLHAALTIAREGSLSAASERLGLSQPTLSKAVARLEREHKIKLFERLPRGMRPTEIGAEFMRHAQKIDLCAVDLYAGLRDLRQSRVGVLRFGAGQGVPDHVLCALAQALVEGGVSLDITGGVTDSLQKAVSVGELEFAIIGLGRAPTEGLRMIGLCDDPSHPMASIDHPDFRGRNAVSWQALASARWVVPAPGTGSYEEFEQNFRAHGLQAPLPTVASRHSYRDLQLATALDAVIMLPKALSSHPDVQERFRPISPEGGWKSQRRLGIVHRTDAYMSPAAQKAMKTAAELLKKPMRQDGK